MFSVSAGVVTSTNNLNKKYEEDILNEIDEDCSGWMLFYILLILFLKIGGLLYVIIGMVRGCL